ncbi:hypothetical protein MalM25_15680 [Planctomycetes bacterium MalM25]|nr:hypothetical protein MalM25_15680 [Planctomycetes bacterium MalM25]
MGIATGASSDFFVLDVDGEEGERSLADLIEQHGELPETVTTKTPRGGRHLYFDLPGDADVRNSAGKLGPKLDVRGDGGYVVAPPSRLPNGDYSWIKSPDEIEVAKAPDWLIELITEPKREATSITDGEVPEGERNQTLASRAGSLRRAGFCAQAMEAALLVENQKICNPPLPNNEVRRIAKSVGRYAPENGVSGAPAYKPFPTETLPSPFREFVEQGAEAIGCDASYLALPLLTGAASAIGNTRRIELKKGWTEPSILWSAIVGDSGTMKSPALEAALRPVKQRQEQAWDSHVFALAECEGQKLTYEKELTAWKKSSESGEPPVAPEEPVLPRTWADDLTVEALASLLQLQPRGLLVACDELASWFGGFDRYAQASGGDAARWLEMHGGRSIQVDRKTGEPRTIFVKRASVSVTGGIQPGVLRRALKPQHRESGLAARLLLANPPRKPKVWTEAELGSDRTGAVQQVFEGLYELQGDPNGDEIVPISVSLSSAAKRVWVDFYNEHAEESAIETGDLAAAWAKLEGMAARLALVIQLVEDVQTGVSGEQISAESMRRGIGLVGWFKHENRRAYASFREDSEEREEDAVVEKLIQKGGSMSVRDLQRCGKRWETNEAATKAFERLKEAGKGDWEVVPPGPKGGRPTRQFVLEQEGDDTTGFDDGV